MHISLTDTSYIQERNQEMKPLHDLDAAASELEFLIKHDLEVLEKHKAKMSKEKDARLLKDILHTLLNLEYDVRQYKEWVERETEGLEN